MLDHRSDDAQAKPWLIIPIELLARELEGRFLLACAAAARGWQVIVGNQPQIIQHIRSLPRGLVFEKSISTEREERLRNFVEAGYSIGNSDEESPAIYGAPERFLTERLNESTIGNTKVFCCWSDLQRDLLIERFPAFADRFVTTGTYRTDVWRKAFRELHRDKANALREKHGPFILFNSNFAYVIHHVGPDYMIKTMENFGVLKTPGMRDYIEKVVVDGRRNAEIFRDVLPKIREWFPDHKLIIRPHPIDDFSYWRDGIRGVENAEVIMEGRVTPWILACDASFHHGCSTGFEAKILGKPSIFFSPSPNIALDKAVSARTSPKANNDEELRALFAESIAGRLEVPATAEPLSRFIDALEGPYAFERILDSLEQVAPEPQTPTQTVLNRKVGTPSLTKRTRIALGLRKAETKTLTDKLKWPSLDVSELEHLARFFASVTDKVGRVSITPVHDEIFWVRARS